MDGSGRFILVVLIMAVTNDVDILNENQAPADHFIKYRQENGDLLGAVDDFDALQAGHPRGREDGA